MSKNESPLMPYGRGELSSQIFLNLFRNPYRLRRRADEY